MSMKELTMMSHVEALDSLCAATKSLWLSQRMHVMLTYYPKQGSGHIDVFDCTREDLVKLAHGMKNVRKNYTGNIFYLTGEVEGIDVTAYAPRTQVCRRVVIGTRVVPREIIEEHEEEEVEWICDEPLLAVK